MPRALHHFAKWQTIRGAPLKLNSCETKTKSRPVPFPGEFLGIAAGKRRPPMQEKNRRFIRQRLRLGPDRDVAVMRHGGEWSINAAQAGFPNFKAKIQIGMGNRSVDLVESAQTDEIIATDSQARGRKCRNGPNRLGVIRVID